MLNKISNSASREEIEYLLRVKFDYASLYRAQIVIDGLKESTVPIISLENPEKIQFGIWGILPQGFYDSWKQFQDILNTLETPLTALKDDTWLAEALQKRRCLIIATGYFTTVLKNHTLYPYFHFVKNQNIFCFAGLYNVLDDGFTTFSIVSHPCTANDDILSMTSPIIISPDNYAEYLSDRFSYRKFQQKAYEVTPSELVTHQISKQFYTDKNHRLKTLQPIINEDFY